MERSGYYRKGKERKGKERKGSVVKYGVNILNYTFKRALCNNNNNNNDNIFLYFNI